MFEETMSYIGIATSSAFILGAAGAIAAIAPASLLFIGASMLVTGTYLFGRDNGSN